MTPKQAALVAACREHGSLCKLSGNLWAPPRAERPVFSQAMVRKMVNAGHIHTRHGKPWNADRTVYAEPFEVRKAREDEAKREEREKRTAAHNEQRKQLQAAFPWLQWSGTIPESHFAEHADDVTGACVRLCVEQEIGPATMQLVWVCNIAAGPDKYGRAVYTRDERPSGTGHPTPVEAVRAAFRLAHDIHERTGSVLRAVSLGWEVTDEE